MVPDISRCSDVREPLQCVSAAEPGRKGGGAVHLSTDPLVSGRVSVATNATAAPIETYQKNQLLWPMSPSHWMTSGAVPPKTATVRLYQAPMPRPRSSVGNSSLMIAGAIELSIA